MRLPEKLEEAFNAQINRELSSSIAYLQMSAYFADRDLDGMASWMRAQSEEERDHAYMFLDFVLDRGNPVEIGAIEAPDTEYEDAEAVFAAALEQEQAVTRAIHDLYRLATEEGDLASYPLLQTFISEQNEEEATVESILERVRLAGDDSGAILLLDRELGSRGSES